MTRKRAGRASLGPRIRYDPDGTERVVAAPPTYETEFEDGWKVALELCHRDGRLVVTRLTVSPEDPAAAPPSGVTTTLLRGIRVAELVENARAAARALAAAERLEGPEAVTAFGHAWNQTLEASAKLASAGAKPGRPRGDLIRYLDVAVEYVALLGDGSLAPAREMAERRDVPRGRIRTWLKVARDKELLTSPGPGERIGGELTEKARAMLAELEKE